MLKTETGTIEVILVDEHDVQIGTKEKLAAHMEGLLHRAFSVFIFNEDFSKLLLQKRADDKYHSGGLWTNTCCSHQRPEESTVSAAERRLKEELFFTTKLTRVGFIVYKSEYENGLTEHEYDHILIGTIKPEKVPEPNPDEASALKFVSKDELLEQIHENPDNYTTWFKKILREKADVLPW